jgi:hypothetical protein
MTKRQLVDEIRDLNPTAGEPFLDQFEDDALAQYLEHLKAARSRVLRIHSWVRKPQSKQRLAS